MIWLLNNYYSFTQHDQEVKFDPEPPEYVETFHQGASYSVDVDSQTQQNHAQQNLRLLCRIGSGASTHGKRSSCGCEFRYIITNHQ